MSNSVFTTLQGLLTSNAGQHALALARDAFPGPIQSVLNDYMNGVTLTLGDAAVLKVDPATRQLSVTAQDGRASIDLQASASGAILTVTSTQYTDAKVVLTFTDLGAGVKLELAATMGATLQWPLQAIWPALLNWTPANEIVFANGALDVLVQPDNAIVFTGQGGILYDKQAFAQAAINVQHTTAGTGVMLGVVADRWSPGAIWAPLSALTFDHSGLVVSTLAGDSGSLAGLGLLKAADVPALQADFTIAPGFLFFSSVQLSGKLAPIAQFMGNVSQLDLFGSYGSGNGALQLQAVLKDSFSAKNNSVFQFDGFSLTWDIAGPGKNTPDSTITASASGTFHPDAGTVIAVGLAGTLIPSEGDLSLTFSLQNWNQPFGLATVDILDLQGGVTVGAAAGGATLSFGGDIKLQNPASPQYEFEVGFEVEVLDFEVPNGIVLWTKADQLPMTLSNVLDAAFALDFSQQAFDQAGEPALGEVVAFLDELISIKQFTAWFVEGASLQKIGEHGPFAAGFGLQAQFALLGQEDVQVSLTLAEKASSSAGFSGYIEMQEAITWGSVFALSGWNEQSGQPSAQGPAFAIAATKDGIVVPGVNQGQPVRFYSSLYLKFLDVLTEHLYALATSGNQFEIDYAVQEGSAAGGAGTWGGDTIRFKLDPSARQLSAAFSFNFGWQGITFSGITLWGVTLVPQISLPNLSVAAGLSLSASTQALVATGFFDFDVFGLSLHLGSSDSPYSLLNVNVSGVISDLKDVADHVLAAIRNALAGLLQDALKTLDAFLGWAKSQLQNFVNGLQQVAQILKDQFQQVETALVNLLKGLGAAAADVQHVMVALGYAVGQVESWVGDSFGCAVKQASNLLP